MIKSDSILRNARFTQLPDFEGTESQCRNIQRGPLFRLKPLQELLRGGDFDIDRLLPANRDVLKDMRRERWTSHDVLQMIVNLLVRDYAKSEWARIDSGRRWVPCDVYQTFYDSLTRQRHRHAQPVYLKFSIDEGGDMTILVASCHGST